MAAIASAVVLVRSLARNDASPKSATLTATPATLTSVFHDAPGGSTIVLSGGTYGTFRGGKKQPPVSLEAAPGAHVTLAIDFSPAVGVHVSGVTVTSAQIAGQSRHIRISNSRFSGATVIRADKLVNADIVLSRNTHRDINVCATCLEGRIDVTGQANGPSGVVIENSTFGPGGNADGVQTGGYGVQILNNEFTGIHESAGVHTDAIQLYGSRATRIEGNWIHDTSSGIMAADGADHEVIENNVIAPGGYPFAISIRSDNGSIIRNNTLPDGKCAWNLACGIVALGTTPGKSEGSGTSVVGNILSEVSLTGGATGEQDYNLIAHGPLAGAHDRAGVPTYTAGHQPDTLAGYTLAVGSPGRRTAQDGNDRGRRDATR
ncbi:right-handed parallel beta-helix repeat-containing protein [Solirubrobacter ginsenosidimutans]|uniref:Right-handed parallel beta-helix repeat-containing protein n=1 Tax=Solirubrobacter ginsenosidimutans TaxID=490573 RepID=A0A9X3N4M8_9ACTN|nr:right-handed parallel beta-helix repeat-containing protein [Solirubrobacter ginsenosidimutans]MDA0166940.1 right-handed parallel beta-helix repeat-containing protein [Solirubrobacter ginsenosidimutans]